MRAAAEPLGREVQEMTRHDTLAAAEENDRSRTTMPTMEDVATEENLRRAFRRVRANKGAPGVDGITVLDLEEAFDEELPAVQAALLAGRYRPQAVRKVEIPKVSGGTRTLGIPTVRDRWVQQALNQVMTPCFDPTFSGGSHGFRPGRSQHGALCEAEQHLCAGYTHVVNLDLAKFFDTVQHDVLMVRVARRVRDKKILQLIGRYLRAEMMAGGVTSPRVQGTPQGGPLSPLLSNILLDDLDKMLEERGHRFVRYADDFLVFKRTERAAHRTMKSVSRYLHDRLKLKVNEAKSGVCTPETLTYLGYAFVQIRGVWGLNVSEAAGRRLREKLRNDLTRLGRGRSLTATAETVTRRIRGWFHYYKLARVSRTFERLDKWIRRHFRKLQLRHWGKNLRARMRGLRARGVPSALAAAMVYERKSYWRLSLHGAMHRAMPNAYIHGELGLLSLLAAHREFRQHR